MKQNKISRSAVMSLILILLLQTVFAEAVSALSIQPYNPGSESTGTSVSAAPIEWGAVWADRNDYNIGDTAKVSAQLLGAGTPLQANSFYYVKAEVYSDVGCIASPDCGAEAPAVVYDDSKQAYVIKFLASHKGQYKVIWKAFIESTGQSAEKTYVFNVLDYGQDFRILNVWSDKESYQDGDTAKIFAKVHLGANPANPGLGVNVVLSVPYDSGSDQYSSPAYQSTEMKFDEGQKIYYSYLPVSQSAIAIVEASYQGKTERSKIPINVISNPKTEMKLSIRTDKDNYALGETGKVMVQVFGSKSILSPSENVKVYISLEIAKPCAVNEKCTSIGKELPVYFDELTREYTAKFEGMSIGSNILSVTAAKYENSATTKVSSQKIVDFYERYIPPSKKSLSITYASAKELPTYSYDPNSMIVGFEAKVIHKSSQDAATPVDGSIVTVLLFNPSGYGGGGYIGSSEIVSTGTTSPSSEYPIGAISSSSEYKTSPIKTSPMPPYQKLQMQYNPNSGLWTAQATLPRRYTKGVFHAENGDLSAEYPFSVGPDQSYPIPTPEYDITDEIQEGESRTYTVKGKQYNIGFVTFEGENAIFEVDGLRYRGVLPGQPPITGYTEYYQKVYLPDGSTLYLLNYRNDGVGYAKIGLRAAVSTKTGPIPVPSPNQIYSPKQEISVATQPVISEKQAYAVPQPTTPPQPMPVQANQYIPGQAFPSQPAQPIQPGQECPGCKKANACLSIGIRLMDNNQAVYCDVDSGVKAQKANLASCQNSFECLSNTCSAGKCIDTEARLKNLEQGMQETQGVLQKIMSWLSKLFGE